MKQTRREFVKSLFIASQAVVASRFLPTDLLAQNAPPGALNFIVMGDWGRRGETDQTEVAQQMGIAAQNTQARFIVAVGDNFYENGVTSVKDAQWQESFENVYTAPSLQVPWYVILGNHDYHANCDAQIEYSKLSPRWKMPARYYQQTHPIDANTTADFFYLDTTPMVKEYYSPYSAEGTRDKVITQDVPRQMKWFKQALASSKAQWKIVIAHHPIYSGGEHGDTVELIEAVLPLLHEHGVQVFFNGHDHDLQHLMAGEVNLFCSGAGSRVRPTRETEHTKFADARSGFMTVALGAEKMNICMIDNHGTVLYTTSVFRKSAVTA
jgi:acid phosphatase